MNHTGAIWSYANTPSQYKNLSWMIIGACCCGMWIPVLQNARLLDDNCKTCAHTSFTRNPLNLNPALCILWAAQTEPKPTVKPNKVEFQKFPCHHGSERAVWQEWRKTKVEGEEDLSACVGLCRRLLRSILARLRGPKPTGLAAASLHVYNQSRHRQTAAIKPRLFQVHRVWKGLIEGLWSQWGWSFSPSSPPSR